MRSSSRWWFTLFSLSLCFVASAAFATSAPSNLAATGTSSSTVSLTWTDNSGSEIGYTFMFDTNAAFANPTYVWAGGANTTSYTHSGRNPATTYYYKIKAEGNPDSSWTGPDSATTAPSNLSASVISNSQINLSWSGNAGNSSIVGYTVARATTSSFAGATYHYVNGAGATAYSSTGLSAGTTYYYKVKAEGTSDAYDSPFTGAISAATSNGVPDPPGNLAASAISGSRIDLSWTDNSTNETGFELKRATDTGFTQNVIWIGNIQGTAYSNIGLNGSTTYYYKVRAEGTAGKSTYSNTASATTPGNPPPPTGGVPISPRFFGVNAWMPDRVGAAEKYGQLHNKWPDVENSRARSVRYGGIAVDEVDPAWIENNPTPPGILCPPDPSTPSTMKQYAGMVDAIRAIGAEPILQVPVLAQAQVPRTAQEAADIVRCINITLQKGVKYWSIGNEPDLAYGWNSADEAHHIAAYMRSFASAMKQVDPTIRIVGPETAWFNWNVLDRLTNGGPDDILDIVDVISFHMYGWPDNGGTTWPNRDGVISYLMAPDSFRADLIRLKDRVALRNAQLGRTGDNALKIAVTEANINWENPSNDSIDGVGAKSFLGGQFWAEVLGIAMQQGVDFLNFWSVIEGNNVANDKGYLCRQQCTYGAFHPSYHHFRMMATHFRGNALLPADDISFDDQPNVKSFAARDSDQIAVIVLNQDASASFDYIVRLNTDPVSAPLKVNIPAGLAAQTTGTIANQSTILLVFDSAGTLKRKIEYKRNPGSTPTLSEVSYP